MSWPLAYRSGWIDAFEQEAAALAVLPPALLVALLLDEMLEHPATRAIAAPAVAATAVRLIRLACLLCRACLMGLGLPSSRSRQLTRTSDADHDKATKAVKNIDIDGLARVRALVDPRPAWRVSRPLGGSHGTSPESDGNLKIVGATGIEPVAVRL